ncbi:MAG TPA: YdeI/OmpD-associated family protein [Planctomycetota bacterium]|nr:YdeI/OmpD-associated family protein [Planctomycetota bacterium]
MVTRDSRIDAYIAKAPDYAKPVLKQLRATIHAACPDVVETMKWRNPSFEHHGLLCGMAAFKQHCTFGFWKHSLVVGASDKAREAWGSFGRMTSVKDLPAKSVMTKLIRKAMKLNVDGVKVVRNKTAPRPKIAMPPALTKALAAHPTAREQFAAFSPSKQREYMEWIGDAKTDATRNRRLEDAIAWIAEGKPRNWKYMKC